VTLEIKQIMTLARLCFTFSRH